MKISHFILLSVAILFIFVFSLSAYTITQGQNGLVLRLGKMVTREGQPVTVAPGIHFKTPMVDEVKILDTRMQQLATSPAQPLVVVTKEQTYLVVQYFAKWRINNLPKFYITTAGSVSWAENLLEQRLNDIVRAEYGKRTSDQAISTDRTNLMAAIKAQAKKIGMDQGINVLDVQIQQITLPHDVIESVYKRMAAERKQFAEAKRAEGIEKSEEIKALADQKVTVIKAQALLEGANNRARGEQKAAEVLTQAYSADPSFYQFYRTLEAYLKSFSTKNDILVVKPEGQFFSYFHNLNAGAPAATKR